MRTPAWLAAWLGIVVIGTAPIAASEPSGDVIRAAIYLRQAAVTQAATRKQLRVLGDATTCDEARFVAYRRSDVEPDFADQWYVASQLWADAELLLAGLEPRSAPVPVAQVPAPTPTLRPAPPRATLEGRCHLNKGFIFLDRLWDYDDAGYHARSDVTGTKVERGARYGDDNAL